MASRLPTAVIDPQPAPHQTRRPTLATLPPQITNTKRQLPTGEAATSGSVSISQVMTEPELVQRSEAFEQAIQGGDREALSAFCQAREQEVGEDVMPGSAARSCRLLGQRPGPAGVTGVVPLLVVVVQSPLLLL